MLGKKETLTRKKTKVNDKENHTHYTIGAVINFNGDDVY